MDSSHRKNSVSVSISRRTFLTASAIAAGTATTASVTGVGVAEAHGEPTAPNSDIASAAVTINIGRGMADMTGELFGAGMNGYAVASQQSSGFRQRQYARAFIFDDGNQRVVHVTADMGLMFQSIQLEVIRRVQALYGQTYHEGNILIGASHTHVAPGGTSGHLMVDLTTAGFRPTTFEATVSGIVTSIQRAHDDLAPSQMVVTRAMVDDAGVNRSRQSFMRNPQEYLDVFPDGVDREAVTLHAYRGGAEIGLINWYGIHPTTFGPEHTIIDGDNKGYAAWYMENERGVNHLDPASAPFVAAFAMSTPGDVSPNHGLIPDSGPRAGDQYESARILGLRQVAGTSGRTVDIGHAGANGSPGSAAGSMAGATIDMRWQWVDMSAVDIDSQFTPDGQPGRTGPAILGAAFAASSQEDGGGEPLLGFNEGERGGNAWVSTISKVVVPPSEQAIHAPKEMLLPVGYIPGMIQQTHIFHLHRIAGLTIASLAFEPTVVAGYRLRHIIAHTLDVDIDTVIVQGYISGYGHYITTAEEYDGQDYEGGATAFGRLTLSATQQIFHRLAAALSANIAIDSGHAAGDLTGQIPASPTGNPTIDIEPEGKRFGDIVTKQHDAIATGHTTAVTFVGANPNSDLRHEQGFLTIRAPGGQVVADDCHENTIIEFAKEGEVTLVTVTWTARDATPGTYDIEYRGSAKAIDGALSPFIGRTRIDVVR